MPAFVVDASAAAAWFLPDEASEYTDAALRATVDTDVWVPASWQLEIGNLLISAQHRKRITTGKSIELVNSAASLRLRADREPVSMVARDMLVATHQLTTYDAYLELALTRGGERVIGS